MLRGIQEPASRTKTFGFIRDYASLFFYFPWHFLNFLPEPHQQGSFLPTSLPLGETFDAGTLVSGSAFKFLAGGAVGSPTGVTFSGSTFRIIIATCSSKLRKRLLNNPWASFLYSTNGSLWP